MPPRRATADNVSNMLANWPTVDDLPESFRRNAQVIQTSLDLEEHIKNIIARNPYVPPTGDRCPINDLPNELLAHIFFLGTYEDDEDDEDDMYRDDVDVVEDDDSEDEQENGALPNESVLPFQVLVSHVCAHWRTVAIEAPALWTAIRFADESPPFTRCQTWIERSKTLSLDIEIDCTVLVEPSEPSEASSIEEDEEEIEQKPLLSLEDVAKILSIITPHIARWRGLEVQVEEYTYMLLVTTALSSLSSAPALEVLQLYHYGEEDEEDYDHFQPAHLRTPFPVLFSGDAPKLTQIALWGVHIAWSHAKNTFLKNLKDLELAYHAEDVRPSWEEFQHIMVGSPELDTLSLCASGPSGQPSEWQSESPIELAGLKNLVLAFHTPTYISSLIKLLHMPNVTSLALDFEADDFSTFAKQLATPRPGTNKSLLKGLEHLKISGLPCGKGTVDVMYEQLGNLRSINLKMNEDFLDGIFFEKLRVPIASPSSTVPAAFYCPNLDTLTTSGIDGMTMRAFIEARRKAGIPVKRVFMSEEDEVNINDEVWLRDQLETFELYEPSDEETDVDLMDDEMDVD